MRYMMFGGSHYYPYGGMRDFFGFANTVEEAIEKINSNINKMENIEKWDWWHIYDAKENNIVKSFGWYDDETGKLIKHDL